MTSGPKSPITNNQFPNKFPLTNHQSPNRFWLLVNWLLVIIWLLGFGHCSFGLSQAPDITSESIGLAPTVESFSFVVFGDNRDGDEIFMDLIEKVNQEKGIEFCVNTGDLVPYANDFQYKKYIRMISKLKYKLYNVVGNHDVYRGEYKFFEKYFGPTYYSFDHRNSHFVLLDNALPRSFDHKQFAWLKKDLATTNKENIFVFMHRPTFDPTEIYKGHVMSGRKVVEELMEVFKKYKVDYVFAGHIHGYARAERNGIVYLVTGGAGAPLYLPKDFGGFYHYVKIEVEGNKIKDEVVRVYE